MRWRGEVPGMPSEGPGGSLGMAGQGISCPCPCPCPCPILSSSLIAGRTLNKEENALAVRSRSGWFNQRGAGGPQSDKEQACGDLHPYMF